MAPNPTAASVGRGATDHPQPAGTLAQALVGRNIALATDASGQTILVRPDSALLIAPAETTDREQLAKLLDRFDPDRARDLREGLTLDDDPIRISLSPDRKPTARLSEPRWTLETVDMFRAAAAEAGFQTDYNYVVVGAQTMSGSPLGYSASWAGDMAFVGQVYEDPATGQVSILSTAQPAPAPAFVRPAVGLDRTPPRVLVLDSGLRTTALDDRAAPRRGVSRRAEHQLLEKCPVRDSWSVDPTPGVVDDEDEPFDAPVHALSTASSTSTFLDFEAGHGTFIAGVITQACPDAEIVSAGVLSSFGDGDVAGVLSTLKRMIDTEGPFDIVVMSFGANLVDDEPGLFGTELMRLLGDSLGVAAAGNQSTCRPYFPAALPGVIGVGALAADGKAWFTNFGGWVDACAPGVDVISTFFNEFTEILDGVPTREYKEWARWSGTSFSAPKVAAAIAQEMYLYGGTAKEAWKRLSTHKHFRYPDLGVVFNV